MKYHSKLIPPFTVFVFHQDGSRQTLAEGMNYPDAIQFRLSWRRELERKGYKINFGSRRMINGTNWQECHISDANGRAV